MQHVLRPGGSPPLRGARPPLPTRRVQRWQHRLDPLQARLFGGCHLDRPIPDRLLLAAGFTITEQDVFYEDGTPKFLAADTLGVARLALEAHAAFLRTGGR